MKLKRQMIALFILLLGALLLIVSIPTTRAMTAPGEIRAALDIGSGSTNLIVAKVDPTTNKITAQLFQKSIPVPYQKHLEQSADNTLDRTVMDQGIQAIRILKETADNYHVKKVVGVATAAFRQAANAEEFAKEIEMKTGVQVRIIDQNEEGILAFRGALALTPIDAKNALVWDIGGGSMQLTSLTDEGTYFVEKGKTASIPFKNYIIEHVQNKDLATVHSPNPMTIEQMQAGVDYAAQLAEKTNPAVLDKIRNPDTKILAVGNLFNFGVKPIAGGSEIEQNNLEAGILKTVGKTDAEIDQGSLSEVAVTNPILVLGYMKGLQISSMKAIEVNNADGALTYPAYWE